MHPGWRWGEPGAREGHRWAQPGQHRTHTHAPGALRWGEAVPWPCLRWPYRAGVVPENTRSWPEEQRPCGDKPHSTAPTGSLVPQAHIYSLGATLKAALEYVAEPEPEPEPRLSQDLEALLSQMQAENPRDRPDLQVKTHQPSPHFTPRPRPETLPTAPMPQHTPTGPSCPHTSPLCHTGSPPGVRWHCILLKQELDFLLCIVIMKRRGL